MAVDPAIAAARFGDTVQINLWYPGAKGSATYLQVGLMHVRAADDIRISYDFDRDGWKIEQAEYTEDECGACCTGPDGTEVWQEVAFIQAWALMKPAPEPTGG